MLKLESIIISILKKILHTVHRSILDKKGTNMLHTTKQIIPRNSVLGLLADADGAVGGLSSKKINEHKKGIAINAISNPKYVWILDLTRSVSVVLSLVMLSLGNINGPTRKEIPVPI